VTKRKVLALIAGTWLLADQVTKYLAVEHLTAAFAASRAHTLEERLRRRLLALAAPRIADPAIRLEDGVGHGSAIHHGDEARGGIVVRGAGTAANFIQGGRLELRQIGRRLVVDAHLRDIVARLVSADFHVHALRGVG